MSSKNAFLFSAIAVWMVGLGWGFSRVLRYEATAGAPGERNTTVTDVRQSDGPATLIMLAHPRCPCTRASIAELQWIMDHCQGRLHAEVYFYQPGDFDPTWSASDTWKAATQLPGTTVHTDVDGRKAKELGAETSGHVVVLDGLGRLLFRGGITGARGHQGENAGRAAVFDLLRGVPVPDQEFPVYGCSLFAPRETSCCKDPSSCRN